MVHFLLAAGVATIVGLTTPIAAKAEEAMHFRSSIGSLNLFMRHQQPTGPRRGPPVLILHGATFPSGNAAAWKIEGRSWMDELASVGYDVYALDFLGYGQSDRYPEMDSQVAEGLSLGDVASMVTQVESAVAQILKVHGGDRVNLVAHSGGSFAAARFAEIHSDKVARLVLFGAPVPYGERGDEAAKPTRFIQVSRADQLESFEPQVLDTGHLDLQMFDVWMKAYLATDPQSGGRSPPSVRVPAGISAAADDMSRLGQLPYDPQKISVPVLVIQGEWDAVAPPVAGMWLYDRLGSALKRFVVVSQAGHRAHLERNRLQLYSEINGFLIGGDDLAAPTYAVFFEVKPSGREGREEYLAKARVLRSQLDKMSGFLGIERFDNQTRSGWLLSLSRWRDETSLIAWREVFEHRAAQEKGRHGVFADYRIRVARQVKDGGDLVLTEESPPIGAANAQQFTSLSEANHRVALVETPTLVNGTHWQVVRDYTLRDRRQAPRE
jgi:pimeloyl-ACP methyl ester carboxylesterase/heme-degrading monooxygenase HmoA